MHHILVQLDPEPMGLVPFTPVIQDSLDLKARDLGLNLNKGAYVHLLANPASFVGSDNTGVLISEEPYKKDEMQLIIDIGTNGEIVLGNKEKLICTSCATGPALEGAQLAHGMRAAAGAIERVKIDPDTHEVDYKIIGRDAWRSTWGENYRETRGICGSGIIDAMAELYRTGIVLKNGGFNPNRKSGRFRISPDNKMPEFVLAWAGETTIGKDIVITQKDVRQVLLAKAAIYCGCKMLMMRMGIEKVDKVKIAGAFGTKLDVEKVLILGLIPDCALNKITFIGNAAGDGAIAALVNREKRTEAVSITRAIEYVDLKLESQFQIEFIAAIHIPHQTDTFPHVEGIIKNIGVTHSQV